MNTSLIKSVGFVHLNAHSAYSLREGALTIEALAERAKADSMPALGIADANNLFGALEFSEKMAKAGIQPIIGLRLTVDFDDIGKTPSRAETALRRAPITLIAKDEAGYRATDAPQPPRPGSSRKTARTRMCRSRRFRKRAA